MVLLMCLLALNLQPAKGHLVLNGGGAKPAVVMETFIRLAGGKDANILVFPTASELADTGEYYRDLFQQTYGCTQVRPLEVHRRAQASNPEWIAAIRQADGLYFSGGDQRRIIKTLRDTPMGEAIRAAYLAGAVIGGTSAGTACMSEWMLTGDGDFAVIRGKNVQLWRGLGLFPKAILDQHFIARKRQNRLISAVLEYPAYLGIGIDEATAIWLKPNGEIEILGDGSVMIYDAQDSQFTSGASEQPLLGATHIKLHILVAGQGYDLNNRRVLPN